MRTETPSLRSRSRKPRLASALGELHVSNSRGIAPGPLAISIDGDAANDFALDNARTTCAAQALGAGESCVIALRFRPTAVGERTATLVVASAPGGMGTIKLIGQQ